jgi:tetratricopeptide (TPR) repeat protein
LEQTSLAQDEYAEVFNIAPQWSASAYWDETPLRMAARDEFLRRSGLDRISLETLSQIPTICWPALMDESSSNPYCEGMVDLAEGHPQKALALFDQAISGNPQNALPYAGRAHAEMLAGDPAAARMDAQVGLFLGDKRAGYILGLLAEQNGDFAAAETYFDQSAPILDETQGWELALYSRRADLKLLRIAGFETPGFTRYELAPWEALAALYETQGREGDRERLVERVRDADPYAVFPAPSE